MRPNLSVNEFHSRALEVHGSKYEYDLETFTGRLKVVKIFCSEHGWFDQIVQNHLSGNGCKECRNKNEAAIKSIIEELGYFVEKKKIKNRAYDFFIPKLNLLIERDGEQHYRPAWTGIDGLIDQKKIDKEKTDLAISNGYKFARIPFWLNTKDSVRIELQNIFNGDPSYPPIPETSQIDSKPTPRGYTGRPLNKISDFSSIKSIRLWKEAFHLLEGYYELFHHSHVTDDFKWWDIQTKREVNLSRWIRIQRKNHDNLSRDQIEELDRIKFPWIPIKEQQWEESFTILATYKLLKGHCYVEQNEVFSNFSLGEWISNQRQNKKKNAKVLTQERIKRLENLGLHWDATAQRWDIMFEQLVKFKKVYNHVSPHGSFKTNGEIYGKKCQNLGFWCDQMRQYKKKNNISLLTKSRIDKLNSLGFSWDASDLKSSKVRKTMKSK